MSEQNKGGPAFPVAYGRGRIEGMTLRDYFAAKAMQARISQPLPANLKDVSRENISAMVAEFAYEMADAMIKARG